MNKILGLTCIAILIAACGSPQPTVYPAAPRPVATNTDQQNVEEPTPGGPTPVMRVTREANQAGSIIVRYASEQLGIDVAFVRSGGITGADLGLPASAAATYQTVIGKALESYGGVLANGTAAVGFGAGANTGDLTVDINTNSIGAFAIQVSGEVPADAGTAVNLIRSTFPALSSLPLATLSTDNGFSFSATSTENVMDPNTLQLLPRNAIAGVAPSGKGLIVYAIVGTGAFATGLVH